MKALFRVDLEAEWRAPNDPGKCFNQGRRGFNWVPRIPRCTEVTRKRLVANSQCGIANATLVNVRESDKSRPAVYSGEGLREGIYSNTK